RQPATAALVAAAADGDLVEPGLKARPAGIVLGQPAEGILKAVLEHFFGILPLLQQTVDEAVAVASVALVEKAIGGLVTLQAAANEYLVDGGAAGYGKLPGPGPKEPFGLFHQRFHGRASCRNQRMTLSWVIRSRDSRKSHQRNVSAAAEAGACSARSTPTFSRPRSRPE